MKTKQGLTSLIVAIVISVLIFVFVIFLYRDKKIKQSEDFGRVVNIDRVERGIDDPGVIENPDRGTFVRENKEVDENMLPTQRVIIGNISIVYPPILNFEKTGTSTARLYHETPSHLYSDFCDLQSDVPVTGLDSITDLNVEIEIRDLSIKNILLEDYPDVAETVVDELGRVTLDKLPMNNKYPVYHYYINTEKCGKNIYFISRADNRTIIIIQNDIPYLSGVMGATSTVQFTSLPGVILPDQEKNLVTLIINGIM